MLMQGAPRSSDREPVDMQLLRGMFHIIRDGARSETEYQKIAVLIDEKQRQDAAEKSQLAELQSRVQALEQQNHALHTQLQSSAMSQAGNQATSDLMKGFSNASLEILKMGTHQQTAQLAEQMAEQMAKRHGLHEIQLLQNELKAFKEEIQPELKHLNTVLGACERDLTDFSSAMEAINVELDEQKTRSEFLTAQRMKSVEEKFHAELGDCEKEVVLLKQAFARHEDWMNNEVVPSVNKLDARVNETQSEVATKMADSFHNLEQQVKSEAEKTLHMKSELEQQLQQLSEVSSDRSSEFDSQISALSEQMFGLKLELLNVVNASRDVMKDFEEQEITKVQTLAQRDEDLRVLARDINKLKSTMLLCDAEDSFGSSGSRRFSFYTEAMSREDENILQRDGAPSVQQNNDSELERNTRQNGGRQTSSFNNDTTAPAPPAQSPFRTDSSFGNKFHSSNSTSAGGGGPHTTTIDKTSSVSSVPTNADTFADRICALVRDRLQLDQKMGHIEASLQSLHQSMTEHARVGQKTALQISGLGSGMEECRKDVFVAKDQVQNLAENFKRAFAHPMFSHFGGAAYKNWNPLADPRGGNAGSVGPMPSLSLPGIRSPSELGGSSPMPMINNGGPSSTSLAGAVTGVGDRVLGAQSNSRIASPRSPRGNAEMAVGGSEQQTFSGQHPQQDMEVSGMFHSFEQYFTHHISQQVSHAFSEKIAFLQKLLEDKVNLKKFDELAKTTEHVSEGVSKLAQITGVIPYKNNHGGEQMGAGDGANAMLTGGVMNGNSNGNSNLLLDGSFSNVLPQKQHDVEQLHADVDLFSAMWRERARTLPTRMEKVWRARCANKCRNVLDMVGKKADLGLLKLLQQSVQDVELQILATSRSFGMNQQLHLQQQMQNIGGVVYPNANAGLLGGAVSSSWNRSAEEAGDRRTADQQPGGNGAHRRMQSQPNRNTTSSKPTQHHNRNYGHGGYGHHADHMEPHHPSQQRGASFPSAQQQGHGQVHAQRFGQHQLEQDQLTSTNKGILEGPPPSGFRGILDSSHHQHYNYSSSQQRHELASPQFGGGSNITPCAGSNTTRTFASQGRSEGAVPSVRVNQMHPQRPVVGGRTLKQPSTAMA
eukprot:g14478.t1